MDCGLRLIIVTAMTVAAEAVFCGKDGDLNYNYAKALCGTEKQSVNFAPQIEQKFRPMGMKTFGREQSITFSVNYGVASQHINQCSTKDNNKATVTAKLGNSGADQFRLESSRFDLDDSAPGKPRTADCLLICLARSCPKIECLGV